MLISDDKTISKEDAERLKRVGSLLANDPGVLFAYLFGSRSRGQHGPLSDFDFAVFLNLSLDLFNARLSLMDKVSMELGSDHFDLVVLNDATVLLQYEVIRGGTVLKESKARRVDFETRVLSRYLDTEYLREVQRHYLKKQLGGSEDG